MNSYKIQNFQSVAFIDGACIQGIDLRSQIKYEMICEFFKQCPEYVAGGTFNFKFVQFDCNSKPNRENQKYHHIIDKCIHNQLNFYELTINIL